MNNCHENLIFYSKYLYIYYVCIFFIIKVLVTIVQRILDLLFTSNSWISSGRNKIGYGCFQLFVLWKRIDWDVIFRKKFLSLIALEIFGKTFLHSDFICRAILKTYINNNFFIIFAVDVNHSFFLPNWLLWCLFYIIIINDKRKIHAT